MSPMELLAVSGLKLEHVQLLTEEDAIDIFDVGAQFVPEIALQALCALYPGVMFRHAESVPPNIFQNVSRQFPEKAFEAGFATQLERNVSRAILRKDPRKLYFLKQDQCAEIVDTELTNEMVAIDPLPVLRAASRWLTKDKMRDVCEEALQRKAGVEGYGEAHWSSFCLSGPHYGQPLSNQTLRAFSTPLGQIGQGWVRPLSVELTNLYEAGKLRNSGADFLVEAVRYTIENATPEQALDIAKSCVLRWDHTQMQVSIAPLSDFHRTGMDYTSGTWYYPRSTAKSKKLEVGPYRIENKSFGFAVCLCFGSDAPPIAAAPNTKPVYIRITLLGKHAAPLKQESWTV